MNEQHTPGPWEWDTSPVDYDPEQEAPWLVTCEHSKVPDEPILQGQIKCHSNANASLIAAAPCLLANLERMVQWYARRNADNDDMLHIDEQTAEVRQAMFAIARALPQGAPHD